MRLFWYQTCHVLIIFWLCQSIYENELIPFPFDTKLNFILWNILVQSRRDMHFSCFIFKTETCTTVFEMVLYGLVGHAQQFWILKHAPVFWLFSWTEKCEQNDKIPSRAVLSGRATQLWNKRVMRASSETVFCSLIGFAQMFL